VAITAISGNSGSPTAIGILSEDTPRTCRTAVPRVTWRNPISAKASTIVTAVHRPSRPRAGRTRCLQKRERTSTGICFMHYLEVAAAVATTAASVDGVPSLDQLRPDLLTREGVATRSATTDLHWAPCDVTLMTMSAAAGSGFSALVCLGCEEPSHSRRSLSPLNIRP
jgi:hypothetical protein